MSKLIRRSPFDKDKTRNLINKLLKATDATDSESGKISVLEINTFFLLRDGSL